MKTLKSVLLALLVVSQTPASALADRSENPMMEIGGGVMTSSAQSGVDVVIRLSVVGLYGPPTQLGALATRVSGEVAFGLGADSTAVPYFNIEAVPLSWRGDDGRGIPLDIVRFGTTQVSRNVRINRDLQLRIDVVGTRWPVGIPNTISQGQNLVFAVLAADVLGFKFSKMVSDSREFSGVNIANASAELRALFGLQKPEGHARWSIGRIVLGASGDVSAGSTSGNGASVLVDYSAYAEAQVNFHRTVGLFVRGALNGIWNSAVDRNELEAQAMLGINVFID